MRKWAVGALVVGAVALVVIWWMRPRPEERMEEFVAELRARGEPVTLQGLELPWPESNGADALERALLALDARDRADRLADVDPWWMRLVGPDDTDVEQPWYEHAPPERLDEFRAFIETIDSFFDEIDAAVEAGSIVWALPPSDREMGTSESAIRADTSVREAAFLLRARVRLAQDDAQRRAALRSYVAFSALPRLRSVIDHLLWAMRRGKALRLVQDLVEEAEVDGAQVRDDLDPWLLDQQRNEIPRALRVERVFAIAILPDVLDGSWHASVRSGQRNLERWNSGAPAPTAAENARHAIEDKVAALTFDTEEYVLDVRRRLGEIPQIGAWSREHEWRLRHFDHLFTRLNEADARATVARIALAACVHHDRHGRWPTVSADLEPLFPDGVPGDPYTDAPVEVRVEDGTLVVRVAPGPGDLFEDRPLRDLGLEWRLPAR